MSVISSRVILPSWLISYSEKVQHSFSSSVPRDSIDRPCHKRLLSQDSKDQCARKSSMVQIELSRLVGRDRLREAVFTTTPPVIDGVVTVDSSRDRFIEMYQSLERYRHGFIPASPGCISEMMHGNAAFNTLTLTNGEHSLSKSQPQGTQFPYVCWKGHFMKVNQRFGSVCLLWELSLKPGERQSSQENLLIRYERRQPAGLVNRLTNPSPEVWHGIDNSMAVACNASHVPMDKALEVRADRLVDSVRRRRNNLLPSDKRADPVVPVTCFRIVGHRDSRWRSNASRFSFREGTHLTDAKRREGGDNDFGVIWGEIWLPCV
uniref:Uncharacterized protein n=1 Tax=Anopheles atroparvus TaxID=41427 RepID=A0A182JKR1_ANOAO